MIRSVLIWLLFAGTAWAQGQSRDLRGIWQATGTAYQNLEGTPAQQGPARRKVDSGGSVQRQNPVPRRCPQIGGSELQRTRNVRSSPLLFPAGHSTGRVATRTIPDLSESGSCRDRLSACSRLSRDLHGWTSALRRRHRVLHGRLTRPMGRKHARGRRDELQAGDMARQRGQFSRQQAPCCRTLYADWTPTPCVTRRPSRIRKFSNARGTSASISHATRSRIFSFSNTNANAMRRASTGILRSS